MGRITSKYIILDIMFNSFFKQKGIRFLLKTSRSFRELLIENQKAASFYAEDALDHIQHLPFTISKIDIPLCADIVLLSGDRVYTVVDKTIFVYSMGDLTHPVFSHPLDVFLFSAKFVDNRLYLGSECMLFVFEVTLSLT